MKVTLKIPRLCYYDLLNVSRNFMPLQTCKPFTHQRPKGQHEHWSRHIWIEHVDVNWQSEHEHPANTVLLVFALNRTATVDFTVESGQKWRSAALLLLFAIRCDSRNIVSEGEFLGGKIFFLFWYWEYQTLL